MQGLLDRVQLILGQRAVSHQRRQRAAALTATAVLVAAIVSECGSPATDQQRGTRHQGYAPEGDSS